MSKAKVVSLQAKRKERNETRTKQNTLCRNGHHKWVVDKAKQFDVKSGRLVTVYRCERCNEKRVKAH